jgi:hypothetical protein
MNAPSMQARYEAEMLRLDAEYASLDVLWSKVRRSTLWLLLAPLVWYGFGWGAAVVALLLAGALVLTRTYLIGVRRSENRVTRKELERELREQARCVAEQGRSTFLRSRARGRTPTQPVHA